MGERRIGFFHVDDGALTFQRDGVCQVVFMSDKGEFDNQISFLHPGDENGRKLHAVMMDAEGVTGLAATSDGPEYLMFELPGMTPGPIFNQMFELPGMTPGPIFNQMFTDLHSGNFPRQSSLDYLTGTRWSRDPRGNDDRSLAIIATLEE